MFVLMRDAFQKLDFLGVIFVFLRGFILSENLPLAKLARLGENAAARVL